jgi:transcription termination factor Rho
MMTREKYLTLSVSVLRGLAKTRGIKGTSTMKKGDLIDAMQALDAREAEEAAKAAEAEEAARAAEEEAARAAAEEAARAAAAEEAAKAAAAEEAAGAEKAPKAEMPEKTSRASRTETGGKNARTASGKTGKAAASAKDEADSEQVPHRGRGRRRIEKKTEGDTAEAAAAVKPEAGPAAKPEAKPGVKPAAVPQAEKNVPETRNTETGAPAPVKPKENDHSVRGILEVMQDGFGFIRSENFLPGEDDVYVSPSQIRRFNLKTGDMISGNTRPKAQGEKFGALLFVQSVNDLPAEEAKHRSSFESMTPIFPNKRIRLERMDGSIATRIVDLISPIGKGQRGMIVSPPKAGKTTLLKDIAKSILRQDAEAYLIILLIDERPEEVTDMKESVDGKNVEIIYSTFDETPEHHKRVSEMVIERAYAFRRS